jgi:hypothetical protein
MVSHVVKGTPEVLENIPDHRRDFQREFAEDVDVRRCIAGLRLCIGTDVIMERKSGKL